VVLRLSGGVWIKGSKLGLSTASAVALFLCLWGLAAFFSLLTGGELAGNLAYAVAAVFAGVMIVRVALLQTAGAERTFWALLAGGLLLEIPASIGLIPPLS
jgi:hypothetical protein